MEENVNHHKSTVNQNVCANDPNSTGAVEVGRLYNCRSLDHIWTIGDKSKADKSNWSPHTLIYRP